MRLKERFTHAVLALAQLTDRVGALVAWAILALLLFAVVCGDNPAKLYAMAWVISKLTTAALIGYGLFAAAEHVREGTLEGIEQAMAATRRITLMAAFTIAAGLIPG